MKKKKKTVTETHVMSLPNPNLRPDNCGVGWSSFQEKEWSASSLCHTPSHCLDLSHFHCTWQLQMGKGEMQTERYPGDLSALHWICQLLNETQLLGTWKFTAKQNRKGHSLDVHTRMKPIFHKSASIDFVLDAAENLTRSLWGSWKHYQNCLCLAHTENHSTKQIEN